MDLILRMGRNQTKLYQNAGRPGTILAYRLAMRAQRLANQWGAVVEVQTNDGRIVDAAEPKGVQS